MWVGHIVAHYILCVIPSQCIHAFKSISRQSYVHHTMFHLCIWYNILGNPYTHATIYPCPMRIHHMHVRTYHIMFFPYMSMLICPGWPITMPCYHLGFIVTTSLGFPHHTHLLNLLSPTFVSFCFLQKRKEKQMFVLGENFWDVALIFSLNLFLRQEWWGDDLITIATTISFVVCRCLGWNLGWVFNKYYI